MIKVKVVWGDVANVRELISFHILGTPAGHLLFNTNVTQTGCDMHSVVNIIFFRLVIVRHHITTFCKQSP